MADFFNKPRSTQEVTERSRRRERLFIAVLQSPGEIVPYGNLDSYKEVAESIGDFVGCLMDELDLSDECDQEASADFHRGQQQAFEAAVAKLTNTPKA